MPAPPRPVPPQPADIRIYSPDGDRLLEITGYEHDAYLYDLRDGSPSGRWVAAHVSQAEFTSRGSDGSPSLRQLELGFYDGSWATADLNATRKVMVVGDRHQAVLYNLTDPGVPPVGLIDQVLSVQFVGGDAGIDGIRVTFEEEPGRTETLVFDRDGADAEALPLKSLELSPKRLSKESAAFRVLDSAAPAW